MQSGLPIRHFIAACNSNDVVPDYFETGEWKPRPGIATWSNAMDVGNPSNFVRILEIMGHQDHVLKQYVSADRVSEEETLNAIRVLKSEHQYLADPHAAVAYCSLRKYLNQHPGQKGIFLETAHPVKFPDAIRAALGEDVPLPPKLAKRKGLPKQSTRMEADYETLKKILREH
jgi:threonine synthase